MLSKLVKGSKNTSMNKIEQLDQSWMVILGQSLHILPEASHFIPEECPEEIAQLVGGFLRPRLTG
jgi:pimeloyl-ACP methyl ester carboxylesterase